MLTIDFACRILLGRGVCVFSICRFDFDKVLVLLPTIVPVLPNGGACGAKLRSLRMEKRQGGVFLSIARDLCRSLGRLDALRNRSGYHTLEAHHPFPFVCACTCMRLNSRYGKRGVVAPSERIDEGVTTTSWGVIRMRGMFSSVLVWCFRVTLH